MTTPALRRELGTGDAVVVGLSAMIGAGVFAVFAPAARAAGNGLLIGLAIAAVVAFCNAVASAQLARRYPTSGGTYVYGREVLGPWWGFTAGWGFVIGKTASCAAMAMTFAAYALPDHAVAQRFLAMAAVLALTWATLVGVTRTAMLARLLLAVTGLALLLVIIAGTGAGAGDVPPLATAGAGGVLQSAGLLFFAFAGYARIATLGEEVRNPASITRAILIAFAVAVTLYAVLAVLLQARLGAGLATSTAPLRDLVTAAGADWAQPVVVVGAAAAGLGALLALLAGVSRATLAMARERDLPGVLARIEPRHSVPRTAQLAIAAAACLLVAVADLRGAIGFSSFGVLLYYAVANLAALRQPRAERQWPRALNILGLAGCLTLVATLPARSAPHGSRRPRHWPGRARADAAVTAVTAPPDHAGSGPRSRKT